jgi:hypothetical protein
MKNLFQHSIYISLSFVGLVSMASLLSGCDDDDPKKEDTPELITRATLTFTPEGGGSVVVVTATDPDGEGVQDVTVDGPINLASNKTYRLSLALINDFAQPSAPGYDISAEVEEEGDEHMFFFAWTDNLFTDPAGNGNIDNRVDDVNYQDVDANGLPLGLETGWTTGNISSGTFRIVLKHQPQTKTSSSAATVGETDLDITFPINIQ